MDVGDRTNKLSLGSADAIPLKNFLRKTALKFHSANIARTYVLVSPDEENPRVWAYITLMCSEVQLDDGHCLDDCAEASAYKVFPAVKVARLAVDTEIQNNGYGSHLVDWAVSVSKEDIMPKIGCRFLITDAKKKAINFYNRAGFTILDTERNKKRKHPVMFMDIHKL